MAHSVPALAAHGRDRHLHPTAAAGDADLPGHQGQGADVEQPVARGVLESEHQVRAHRERRGDRRGVVWYSGQFWALYFIQQVQKPDVLHPAMITGAALLLATPSLILFGWLSDKIGRKPIILAGFALASLTYYPLYTALGNAANPANTNYPLAILIVAIMVSYVGMVYGPIGAFLAEYFPARIRYSSVSVPYHIGNGWGGGLVPIITPSAYLSTHNLGSALIYPIVVPAVAFVLGLFLMPETRRMRIWISEEAPAVA